MKQKELELGAIIIAGISIRTNNNNGQAQQDIADLWARFISEQISSKIEHKTSDDIYCIYTNYVSDFNDDYTTFIGSPISKKTKQNFLEYIDIEPSKYIEFTLEGAIPQIAAQIWSHIWNNKYPRAYKTDFDVYTYNHQDAENSKLITYLSIT